MKYYIHRINNSLYRWDSNEKYYLKYKANGETVEGFHITRDDKEDLFRINKEQFIKLRMMQELVR